MYKELTDLANELDELGLFIEADHVETITKLALMGPDTKKIEEMKQKSTMTMSQGLHLTLDLIGLVPGYGEGADLANAALYLSEGLDPMNIFNAAVSVTSMISGLGDLAKVIKYAGKAISPVHFKLYAQMVLDNLSTIQAIFSRFKNAEVVKNMTTYVNNGRLLSQNADAMFKSIRKWAENIVEAAAKREVSSQAEQATRNPGQPMKAV